MKKKALARLFMSLINTNLTLQSYQIDLLHHHLKFLQHRKQGYCVRGNRSIGLFVCFLFKCFFVLCFLCLLLFSKLTLSVFMPFVRSPCHRNIGAITCRCFQGNFYVQFCRTPFLFQMKSFYFVEKILTSILEISVTLLIFLWSIFKNGFLRTACFVGAGSSKSAVIC